MESIEELSGSSAEGGQGGDQLLLPPANPAGPPQAIADMIRNSAQRNVDWIKTPGRVMQGITPTIPGQWSEEDEFRQQSLNQHQYDWGAQTAFSDVFWPRAGGTGQVTSGAAIPPKRTTVQGGGMPVEVGKGSAKIEVPAGWKVTPVEHDPFLTSLTQAPEKRYVGGLQEAESRAIKAGDEQSFFSVLDQLKNDPELKVADMQAIAKHYGDGFPLEKTKKGALDYIRMKFFERAYQAAKMVQVDKGSKF